MTEQRGGLVLPWTFALMLGFGLVVTGLVIGRGLTTLDYNLLGVGGMVAASVAIAVVSYATFQVNGRLARLAEQAQERNEAEFYIEQVNVNLASDGRDELRITLTNRGWHASGVRAAQVSVVVGDEEVLLRTGSLQRIEEATLNTTPLAPGDRAMYLLKLSDPRPPGARGAAAVLRMKPILGRNTAVRPFTWPP